MSSLARFALKYGLNTVLLEREDPAYRVTDGPSDDGRIGAIRIVDYGRLGNRFYQLLHAMLLARLLGCSEVQMEPIAGGPNRFPVELDGMHLALTKPLDNIAVLSGNFFSSIGFEPILAHAADAFIADTLRHFVAPAFADLLDVGDLGDKTEIVLSFRGGTDIFPSTETVDYVHPYYVQPPAAYYLACVEHAVATYGVRRVRLVFDDRRNPALAAVEDGLRQRGILCVTAPRFGLRRDFAMLLHARYLVIPFTTFSEAAAALSPSLLTVYGFRRIEGHGFLYPSGASILERLLGQRGVLMMTVHDRDGAFTADRDWRNTAEQRQALISYPLGALEVTERVFEPPSGPSAVASDIIAASLAERRRASTEIVNLQAALRTALGERDAARAAAQTLCVTAREFGWTALR